jgi:AraC-like DNA-binding protein
MDVLADRLDRARARGAVFAFSTLQAPWGVDMGAALPMSIHVVVEGSAWLELADHEPLEVTEGDLVVVASRVAHRLVHEPGGVAPSLEELARYRVPGTEGTFVVPGDGPLTLLVCGSYRFDGDLCDSLLDALPPVVHLRAADIERIRPLIDLLADEIAGTSPGRSTVLDRTLDVLLVQLLRIWFSKADSQAPAWFRALDHPQVGLALRLLHEEPSRKWRVDTLAREVGLSRAAFARQFTAQVGVSPLRYLTDWRMGLAAERLRDSNDSMSRIARAVGYDNEFAFSVAFRRYYGQPPSTFRRALRDAG